MKSQTVYTNKGFTLVEILVTVGLISILLVIGSIVNVNMYTRGLRSTEHTILVSTLQKARSRAMNNINAKPHGVYVENGESNYVLFEGDSYEDADDDEKEFIPRNPNITIESDFDEVVFEQLSGEPSETGEITLTDINNNEKSVVIENNGLIIW